MKHQTKKKKKNPRRLSLASTNNNTALHGQQQQQSETVLALMEAFDSISFREASTACDEANGDIKIAADILSTNADDPSTSSVSSGSSGSTSSSIRSSSEESNLVNKRKGLNKQKRVVAVTGTVSTVIGKEYVRRDSSAKAKDFGCGVVSKEDAEHFLCSMLSDDCDLSLAVVRDVLCQCGYDLEKAVDVLLALSASSFEQSRNDGYFNHMVNYKDDTAFLVGHNEIVTDQASDCTSTSAESEVHESIWGYDCRNYSQVIMSSESPSTIARSNVSDLPQKVLEGLFNISRSSEHEPGTMNWRNVARKLQSLVPAIDMCPLSDAAPQHGSFAKGAEYHLYRHSANQHWDSRTSYYQKAAAAYSKGNRQYASYLSDQGSVQTKLAREADERASKDIFEARNKDFENVITIDLHGQHVKQAMRLLKLHLLFGTYVRSVQTLRVITGCGNHGLGKSKLKQSIIILLEKEGIRWSEENRGTLLIKLDGFKEYSFLDSESDTE
ncbi:ATP binding protein, putative [Ricinus communis]|uniref:ATP binding protein, putative n=1 Tax=Ricinus communis TaxID=3988 RepID=B9SI24_RICCO|nr:ATP binding protein, putative [Ricinus communis]|eukprot:XP_002525643.1 SMR domain-containing protein At5g58720 [Ricinus communis]